MAVDSRGTSVSQSFVGHSQACEWDIACHGFAKADVTAIGFIRRQFAESWTGPGKGSMRHMEDQTVAALEAVRTARSGSNGVAFDQWAVLGCPILPGRATFSENLGRYAKEGAFAISPQVIPQCSLHSLPGQLSIVLGAHGPNLGVGGWPGTEHQVWSTAWSLEKAVEPEGFWLIWSCRESDISGLPGSDSVKALALAVHKPKPDSSAKWRVSMDHRQEKSSASWCPWKMADILDGNGNGGPFSMACGAFGLSFVPLGGHA